MTSKERFFELRKKVMKAIENELSICPHCHTYRGGFGLLFFVL